MNKKSFRCLLKEAFEVEIFSSVSSWFHVHGCSSKRNVQLL